MKETLLANRYINAFVNTLTDDLKVSELSSLSGVIAVILHHPVFFEVLKNPLIE